MAAVWSEKGVVSERSWVPVHDTLVKYSDGSWGTGELSRIYFIILLGKSSNNKNKE